MTAKITFTLDGREVEAEAGETIWQVAQRHGTTIPHLCWHPAPGYRADGNCRACVVEVEGERVLAASCQRKPTRRHEGEDSHRAREEIAGDGVRAARRRPAGARRQPRPQVQVLELDRRHGRQRRRAAIPKRTRPASDTTHAAIAVNLDACINCGLCVRACREVQVNDVIGMAYRGHGVEGRVRFRQGHGRVHLRRLRRVRAGVPDRRADGGEPARQDDAEARRLSKTRASTRCAPIAASAARPRCTSRTTRSSTSTAATGRPTTTGCASRAASASTTSITPTA